MSRSRGVVGVALAGGQSRRMGRDKARLRLGGASLVERTVARLRSVTDLVVVADRGLGLMPACRSVSDGPGAGPVAGILGAGSAYPDHDLLVLACDLPEITEGLLRRLMDPIEEDVHLPRWHRGIEPLCALYRPAALALMSDEVAAGRLALYAMLRSEALRVCYLEGRRLEELGSPERLFLNLNTPEDLKRLQAFTPS